MTNNTLSDHKNKRCAINDPWSIAAIKDELTFQLSSICSFTINEDTGQIYITYKYYDIAEWVLYRLNIWKPGPVFVINGSDLTRRLQSELEQLYKSSPKVFDKVVTDAVQTTLEGVNQRYYHVNGIAYKVTWRFDP